MTASPISGAAADCLLAELRQVIDDLRRDARVLHADVEFVIEARPVAGGAGDVVAWADGSASGVQHRAQCIVDGLRRLRDLRRLLGRLGTGP